MIIIVLCLCFLVIACSCSLSLSGGLAYFSDELLIAKGGLATFTDGKTQLQISKDRCPHVTCSNGGSLKYESKASEHDEFGNPIWKCECQCKDFWGTNTLRGQGSPPLQCDTCMVRSVPALCQPNGTPDPDPSKCVCKCYTSVVPWDGFNCKTCGLICQYRGFGDPNTCTRCICDALWDGEKCETRKSSVDCRIGIGELKDVPFGPFYLRPFEKSTPQDCTSNGGKKAMWVQYDKDGGKCKTAREDYNITLERTGEFEYYIKLKGTNLYLIPTTTGLNTWCNENPDGGKLAVFSPVGTGLCKKDKKQKYIIKHDIGDSYNNEYGYFTIQHKDSGLYLIHTKIFHAQKDMFKDDPCKSARSQEAYFMKEGPLKLKDKDGMLTILSCMQPKGKARSFSIEAEP